MYLMGSKKDSCLVSGHFQWHALLSGLVVLDPGKCLCLALSLASFITFKMAAFESTTFIVSGF